MEEGGTPWCKYVVNVRLGVVAGSGGVKIVWMDEGELSGVGGAGRDGERTDGDVSSVW